MFQESAPVVFVTITKAGIQGYKLLHHADELPICFPTPQR